MPWELYLSIVGFASTNWTDWLVGWLVSGSIQRSF